jgi:hypothetical protein
MPPPEQLLLARFLKLVLRLFSAAQLHDHPFGFLGKSFVFSSSHESPRCFVRHDVIPVRLAARWIAHLLPMAPLHSLSERFANEVINAMVVNVRVVFNDAPHEFRCGAAIKLRVF